MSGTTATLAAREGLPIAGPAPAAGRRRLTRRHGLVAFGGLSAAAMTPLLAACGAPEAAPSGSAGTGKVQGTVRVVWQDPTPFVGYKEVWERTFAAFQQANPGAKVEPEWIVSGDRREKILAATAAGDPGDVFWTNNAAAMHEFSARKISRPLDDLVARSKYNLGAHYPHAIEVNRYQGKIHGLPKTTHPGIAAVLYNVDAFRRVGVTPPPPAWTYADLITVAKKLSTPNSAPPGFGFVGFQDGGRWLTPLYSWGGDLLDKEGKASAVKQPATLDAFTWLEDLFQKQGISPDAATASSLGGAAGMFTSGASAMLPVGFWQIAGTVNKVTDFAWKTLPIPVGKGGRVSGYAANDNLTLFSSSKNPDAAWAYMQTWMQDEFLLSLVQIGFNPSSKPAVNTHASLQSLPYYDAVKVTVEQLASNKFGTVPTPANQLQSEVLTAGNTAVSSLWQRKASVRDVLETLDQAVRETLSKPLPGA